MTVDERAAAARGRLEISARLIADGYDTEGIAEQMGVSIWTARRMIRRLRGQYGAGSLAELAERIVDRRRAEDGPTDDEVYNRPGVEGGIGYPLDDGPGSLGENDPRL